MNKFQIDDFYGVFQDGYYFAVLFIFLNLGGASRFNFFGGPKTKAHKAILERTT
jgi:hypothetical protein